MTNEQILAEINKELYNNSFDADFDMARVMVKLLTIIVNELSSNGDGGGQGNAVIIQNTNGTYPARPESGAVTWIGDAYPSAYQQGDTIQYTAPAIDFTLAYNANVITVECDVLSLTRQGFTGTETWQASIERLFTYTLLDNSDTVLETIENSTLSIVSFAFAAQPDTTYKVQVRVFDSYIEPIRFTENTILIESNNIYNAFVALSPLYAVDLRNSEIADATVANAGSLGGTLSKSGTFTKNVGLVAGTDALIKTTFTTEVFGNSAISGSQDWVMLAKVKANTTDTNKHFASLYATSSAASNRIRTRSGAVANDGKLSMGRNDAPSSISFNTEIGTTQVPNDVRVFMLVKVANEIKVYENGSTTPTNTFAVGATTEFNFQNFELFGGQAFGAGTSASLGNEIEYAGLHFVDAGSLTNVQDFIDLMELNA